jgi:predicted transcriptional regulator
MAVSLRVPEDVKKRIARLAQRRNTTPHALMLEAINEKLQSEEARTAFHAEARRRLKGMKRTGMAIRAGEVFEYLEARGEGRPAARPKARKLT